ncbi:MAG: rane spanning protein [Nocardioidaceae bacterium]|nr:rane spanning protein [Nocardioidaceae bacterium]
MSFLVRVIASLAALAVAIWLFDGITIAHHDRFLTLVGVAVIFAVINAFVKPVVKLLALPFIILTLGLLLLVINAALLLLTSKISDGLDLGFHVDGFGTAVFASIVISLVTWFVSAVLPESD